MIATRQRLEVLAKSRGLTVSQLTTAEILALVAEIEAIPDSSSAPFPPVQPVVPAALLARRAGGTGGACGARGRPRCPFPEDPSSSPSRRPVWSENNETGRQSVIARSERRSVRACP